MRSLYILFGYISFKHLIPHIKGITRINGLWEQSADQNILNQKEGSNRQMSVLTTKLNEDYIQKMLAAIQFRIIYLIQSYLNIQR
jgi:hypothetical protein